MNQLGKWARILVINLGVLLTGLLLVEVFFGDWFDTSNSNVLNIPKNVDISWDVSNLYEHDGPVKYRRDHYGFRGEYPSPAEIDILTVGGSTTEQKLTSEGETWQDILQKKFHSNGREVWVVNAGIAGQSSYGTVANFRFWFPQIPGLRASYVLIYNGINDIYISPGNKADDLKKSDWKWRSALYRLYVLVQGNRKAGHFKLPHSAAGIHDREWTTTPLHSDHKALMKEHLIAFEERTKLLVSEIREFGATPIFVTQPSRAFKLNEEGSLVGLKYASDWHDGVRINGIDAFHMLSLLNEVSMKVCANSGGICIDLAKDLMGSWTDNDFYDVSHYTPAGCRKIGEYLYSQLKDKVSVSDKQRLSLSN